MKLIEIIAEKAVQLGIGFAQACLILVVGFFAISSFSRFLKRLGSQYHSTYVGMILAKTVYYLGWFLIIMLALDKTGFNTTQILGAAGVLGVAVGFASQTSFSNIISGIFLIAEKPFVVGDKIQVDQWIGKIISIDLLSIKLVNNDNDYIRIPNEFLLKNGFVNLTRYPIRRVAIEVHIDYETDPERIIALLNELVKQNKYNQSKDRFESLVTDFGSSSITITSYMWVNSKFVEQAKSNLMIAIKQRFDHEKVHMPYPQIVVKQVVQ